MKISVTVKANSRVSAVTKINEGEFLIRVREPAKEGKANQAVVESLSEYLGIAKGRISIIRGQKSTKKIIEVL